MLNIITGPENKTFHTWPVSQVIERAVKFPDKKFIIMVPEQATLEMQRLVVAAHPTGVCMNIDVVSFDRLAHVILAKLGRDVTEILDDVGKALILRRVLESCSDSLIVYRNKIRMRGFVDELQSMITEFKQYGIDDNQLFLMEEAAGTRSSLLTSKIKDLRLILSLFNKEIENKYNTPEELLEICANELSGSDFIRNCDIFLDGFTGFTPVQYAFLEKLLKCSDNVTCTVSVPADRINESCPEYDVFALANETFLKLKKAADRAGVSCKHTRLEELGLSGETQEKTSSGYGLGTIEEEIRFCAMQILRLTRYEERRYSSIGVLTSDMDEYYEPMKKIFTEAGISTFFDYKAQVSDNLLVRFIIAALEMSINGLTYKSVFKYLKTGLPGLANDQTDLLENYCLEFNIRGRGAWESGFTLNRQLYGDDNYAWDLEKLNGYRSKVYLPMTRFYGMTKGTGKMAAVYCRALKRLLEDVDAGRKMKELADAFEKEGNLALSKQYEQIYDQICKLIDKIHMLMGNEKMSIKEFSEIISGGIDEIKVGIIPPAIDSLIVGDLTRTRLGNVDYLFILGMNSGKVPKGSSGSTIFTQRERQFLKGSSFEIAPTVLENVYRQRYYLYLAFNKPSEGLSLSWANVSPAGEQLVRSGIFGEIEEFLPGGICEPVPLAEEKLLWRGRGLVKLAENIRNFIQDKEAVNEELLDYFAKESPEELMTILSGAFYTNRQGSLDERVALDLYGEVLKGSVSRYESYFACPFRHFLSYGLGLERRREYKVEAADLGTVYHEALERYSRALKDNGLTFRDISDEDSHRIIADATAEAISNIPGDVLSGSARNENLKKRMAQITSRTTDVLRSQVRAGSFEPDLFELKFEEEFSENVTFKGKIDRVDIYDSGDIFVKIIDYKSGSKKFSVKDIYSGLQLQLVAYMDSAVKAEKELHPGRNVRPGGVYYYLINDRYIRSEDEARKKHQMSGLTSCEEGIMAAVDGETATARSSNIISTRSIANEGEFLNLISFVRGKIDEASQGICAGNIQVAPCYTSAADNGCNYCAYSNICKFEPGSFGTEWRENESDTNVMEGALYGRN